MNYSPYYGLISDVQFFLLLFHGRTCCGLFWMYLKFKKNCIIICSNECSVDNHIYLSVRALEFYIEWPAQSIQISTSSNPEPCSKVYGKNRHYDHWNTHNNTINVMPIVKTELNPTHPNTYWSACPCMMRFGPVPDSDPVPPMLAA